MFGQTLPSSAAEYARAQRAEIGAAVASVARSWRRMGTEFDPSWTLVGPRLVETVERAQSRVAAGSLAYIPDVLDELGQVRAVDAAAAVTARPLVGYAGDGRPVDSLLYGGVVRAKELVGAGASPRQALARSGQWVTQAVGTVLSDTGRHGESLAMGVRPVTGYVRMLNPPSCSRCAILAGRFYRKNTGFPRHPKCDCRHIPSTESLAGGLTVDPRRYFDSLSKTEQDRIFTRAGAEAVREGADIGSVVNARRGMRTAQVGGRSILTTTKRASSRRPRLMPETIGQIATNRADYLRLLGANGYLL